MAFRIEYSPDAVEHLRGLKRQQQSKVVDAVERSLGEHAAVESRNRKSMRPNSIAPWELRVGNVRVYYDFECVPEPVVRVRAVGIKTRDTLRIGGKVIAI